VGAATSVVCNNLPAASLLAARPPADPHALLVGLDLGPNLAVTGALSAVLWLQAGRAAGSRPSAARYSRLGLVVAPVSMAAALVALHLAG
jgi:arsenical pump membrane protein